MSRKHEYEFLKAAAKSDAINRRAIRLVYEFFDNVFCRFLSLFRRSKPRRVCPSESGITSFLKEDFSKIHQRINVNLKAKQVLSPIREEEVEEDEEEEYPEIIIEQSTPRLQVQRSRGRQIDQSFKTPQPEIILEIGEPVTLHSKDSPKAQKAPSQEGDSFQGLEEHKEIPPDSAEAEDEHGQGSGECGIHSINYSNINSKIT